MLNIETKSINLTEVVSIVLETLLESYYTA